MASSKKKQIIGSMVLVEIICAILFILFAFFFLYFFQADVLGYAQHVLSHGATVYSPFVGALIILVLCILLKLLVQRFTPVYHIFSPASSWFPSALLIAFLTDCHIKSATELTYGSMWWLGLLFLVGYFFCVWLGSRIFPFALNISGKGSEWKALWVNLALMSFVLFTSAMLSNTNINEHVQFRMERMIAEGKFAELEELDKTVQLNDTNLVKYRAYALEKQNALGERFFEYTHEGNGQQLFTGTQVIWVKDSLYNRLGVRPGKDGDEYKALEWLREQKRMKKTAKDYLLTAYLMDCRLDDFVTLLAEETDTTATADSLTRMPYPKHYREALTIYNHQTQTPLIVFADPAMEEDYEDFMKVVDSCPDPKTLRVKLRENYYNTYWYYYLTSPGK